jgi:O-antigen/teichoic acid export membrane protein
LENNLKHRTITGISWGVLTQLITQVFAFVISAIIAKALGPKAFGLVGMITVFTGFANLFHDLGLSPAIIQRKELEPRHLDAAFWANAGMGAVMALIVAGLAPVLSRFYHEPQLLLLTVVLSLRFVLDSLNTVQNALLNRDMHFKIVATVQIWSTVLAGLVGLGMALNGFGVWSLIGQTLSGATLTLLLSWFLSDWRPRFRFESQALKDLLGVSSYVMAFNSVNYWCRAADQFLIGRYAGAAPLGLYSRAYTLMLLPMNQVTTLVGRVIFPALSAIQDDKPKVKRSFLKAVRTVALITFPMMIGLFVVSDHFILAVLNPEWAGAIPILKIFCWVGLMQSVSVTTGWIYLSQGKTKQFFVMGAITSALCVLAFLIGIQWGAMGVAWAYLIYNVLETYPLWVYSGGLIGLDIREAARTLSPPLWCAGLMAIGVGLVGWLLPSNLQHWAYLAIQIPIGASLYMLLIHLFDLDAWTEVRDALSEWLGGRIPGLNFLTGPARAAEDKSLS